MIYPVGEKICLGVIGVKSGQDVEEWGIRGANLVCKFGDQSMLPVWAANADMDYCQIVTEPGEIGIVANALTPSAPVLQPALWWANPVWPSSGGDAKQSEPQQWVVRNNVAIDVERVKSFSLMPRTAPMFVYDAGHKSNHWRRHIESLTDLGCAAMYDQMSGYPSSFAAWSIMQSFPGPLGFVSVMSSSIPENKVKFQTTPRRVRRNCWVAMVLGASGLMAYNVARANDDEKAALSTAYREIASVQRFFMYRGSKSISHDGTPIKDFEEVAPNGKSIFKITGIRPVISGRFVAGNEVLTVRINLENDDVWFSVTSNWKRP